MATFGTLGALAAAEIEDLEGLSDTELIGYLSELEGLGAAQPAATSKAKARVTAAIARKHGKKGAMAIPRSNNLNGETRIMTDKALFENRLTQLDKAFADKLRKGELQICDWSFYAVKNISGVTNVKMFEDGDITGIGQTNVVQGRMFPEDHFLATSLRVLTSEKEGATDGKGLHFGLAADAVVNGEFKLGQESTVYMEKTSALIFATGNRTDNNTLSGNELAVKQPNQNEADRFFQSFGGLGGFMAETRNQIGNQLDLQYARRDLGKAESQIVALESKNEQLTAKNEELSDKIKELKDKIHDLERDSVYNRQNYEQRANMLQLVTNGVVGFVGSQLGVTPEKLSGLLGLTPDEPEEPQQQQPQPPQQNLSGEKDERQEYIDAIVEYIYTLDLQQIKLFAGIAQYTSQSVKHLAKTYEYLRSQFKTEQNDNEDNNGTSEG